MTLPAQALKGLEWWCVPFFLLFKLHTISVAFHYLIMNRKNNKKKDLF